MNTPTKLRKAVVPQIVTTRNHLQHYANLPQFKDTDIKGELERAVCHINNALVVIIKEVDDD